MEPVSLKWWARNEKDDKTAKNIFEYEQSAATKLVYFTLKLSGAGLNNDSMSHSVCAMATNRK